MPFFSPFSPFLPPRRSSLSVALASACVRKQTSRRTSTPGRSPSWLTSMHPTLARGTTCPRVTSPQRGTRRIPPRRRTSSRRRSRAIVPSSIWRSAWPRKAARRVACPWGQGPTGGFTMAAASASDQSVWITGVMTAGARCAARRKKMKRWGEVTLLKDSLRIVNVKSFPDIHYD